MDRQGNRPRGLRERLDPGAEQGLAGAGHRLVGPSLKQVPAADAADPHPDRIGAKRALRRRLRDRPGPADRAEAATGGGVAGPVVRGGLARRPGDGGRAGLLA